MEMEIKLISTENIKPASPTPKHLQKYHLSFIDQGILPIFTPIIYFYSSDPEIPNSQKSDHLKKSLSETLSTYYPLAGRLVGNLYVDCNDAGAIFTHAQAECDLTQAISDRNPENLTQFLPYEMAQSRYLPLAIQATFFRCGGVALAFLALHKIADGLSELMFIKTWSAVARNGHSGGVPLPKFDGAAYFPPQDVSDSDLYSFYKETMKEGMATRMFKFTAPQISLLRQRYSGAAPSRVEALTVHIWTRLLAATGMQSDPNMMAQIVNLRNRVNELPPTEYHFGNFFGVSVAAGDGGVELLRKIQEANKSCYTTFMDLLKGATENGVTWFEELMFQHLISFNFTSSSGFPVYDVDFGWGKPVWVGMPGLPVKNLIIIMPTEDGADFEVVIRLAKQDMEKFEVDFQRQQFTLKSNL